MLPYFFIHADKWYRRVDIADIRYIQPKGGHHVQVVTGSDTFNLYLQLRELADQLPADLFARVNRYTVVALSKITRFNKDQVFIGETSFSLTDKFRLALRRLLPVLVHGGKLSAPGYKLEEKAIIAN